MNQDIRWKQRLENFDRALGLLQEALAGGQENLSPLDLQAEAIASERAFRKNHLQFLRLVSTISPHSTQTN